MVRIYVFTCEKCSYETKIAGGEADGDDIVVQTILCKECEQLYDAVTLLKVPSSQPRATTVPRLGDVADRLVLVAASRWDKYAPACPLEPEHPIRLWRQPDKCPKCGSFMEPGAMPFREWR